ncbi:uncharacterized protein LOC144599410 [Rhinoraja longicauda]
MRPTHRFVLILMNVQPKLQTCQQICTNAIGSFICSCYSGFSIDEAKPSLCVDIDECGTKTSHCQQICTNAIGSFICSCDPGFSIDEVNPLFCVEPSTTTATASTTSATTSETTASTTFASAAATRSTEQSTTMTPYTTESTSTVPDIDECATKTSNCQQICTNAIGNFICSCDPGFSIDGANPSFVLDKMLEIQSAKCQLAPGGDGRLMHSPMLLRC